MATTALRPLRLLLAVLTVWCLGCDAYELAAESLTARVTTAATGVATDASSDDLAITAAPNDDADGEEAADACHCVLGHAAVAVTMSVAHVPGVVADAFADRPAVLPLPAPEPRVRPPVV